MKPKVYFCVLKLLLLEMILNQLNPTDTFTGTFCKNQLTSLSFPNLGILCGPFVLVSPTDKQNASK
jgi:hypothetical protein